VWQAEEHVVGTVLVEVAPEGTAFIDDLIVEPALQRRGIGRSLLERAIEELTRDVPRRIELTAVRFGAPYRLYLKVGFGEVPPPEGRIDGHWVRGRSPF
jgi:GNAT superfamily N-acetyltransferase